MVTPIAANITVNRGTCPHGNPIGACPICSGGGGGGGVSSSYKKGTVPGGMTWDECFAYLRMQRTLKQHTQDERQFNLNFNMNVFQNNKVMQFMENKMTTVMTFLQINITCPIANFAARIFSPIVNIARNIANSPIVQGIRDFAQKIQKNVADIANKVASFVGEPIMAAAKFISESWSKSKLKKFFMFSPVDTEMEQGDEAEETELKKWLGIKNFKEKIGKFFTPKKNKKEMVEWL